MKRYAFIGILIPVAFFFTGGLPAAKKAKVRTGLDRLLEKPDQLKGKRIALIVNHSAIDSRGRHIIDLLHPKYKIVKIFAPEHGVRGKVDEHVSDGKDSKTRLPVISLYQRKKKAPTDQDLADVDLIIFDIQEIGVRYYTYASTMVMAMKAAKASGKKMLVLDRPNMAAGLGIYGPLLENKFHGGFAGYYPIPITHAMTIGELANYYNVQFQIGANVEVIPLSGYDHNMYYDQTGLPWRNPSPSIVDMNSVLGYHLAGSLESLNISVGRGTKHPFQYFGNPFLNAGKITKALNAAKLPGLKFYPVTFRPKASAFRKKQCRGFRMVVTNRKKIDPMRSLITIAREVYKNLPEKNREKNWLRIAGAVGDTDFTLRMAQGESADALMAKISGDVKNFSEARKNFLLYP